MLNNLMKLEICLVTQVHIKGKEVSVMGSGMGIPSIGIYLFL